MRENGRFVGGVRVLDLAKCGSASAVDGITLVQGLKTGVAFFTFLRANLTLSSSALSPTPSLPFIIDQWDTDAPDLTQLSIPSLTSSPDSSWPPSPSSPSAPSSSASSCVSFDGDDDRDDHLGHRRRRRIFRDSHILPSTAGPETTIKPLTSEADRAAGMDLVAASIAEMDHRATKALALHPACLAVLATSCAAAFRVWVLHSAHYPTTANAHVRDLAFLLLLLCTAASTYLAAIRRSTTAYHDLADAARKSWLQPDDILLGAFHAGSLVGVLVLRLEPTSTNSTSSSPSTSSSSSFSSSSSSRKRRSTRSLQVTLRGGKGVVRAWTTKLGSRNSGVGRDLLGAAVRMTKDRCGREARVGFAKEHANSAMVLPDVFNHCFRRDEMRAARALEKELGAGGEKRASKLKKRSRR